MGSDAEPAYARAYGFDPRELAYRPAFAAIAPWLARLPPRDWPAPEDLDRLLPAGTVSGGGAAIRFRAPAPGAGPYEFEVYRTGRVATRAASLHDLFNALAWCAFPRAKAALNRLHVSQAGAARPGTRGAGRDRATLFDESGMLVASSDPGLLNLLRGFCWRELFVARRAAVIARMRFLVFGHALLEKAVAPWKGVTGQALLLPVDDRELGAADLRARLDARIASGFAAGGVERLSPLPILGIPGWCADNEDAAYYDDVTQFRPGRRARPAPGGRMLAEADRAVAAGRINPAEESPGSTEQGAG